MDRIEKSFIMMLDVRNHGFITLGSFDCGEEAVGAREEFKGKFGITTITEDSEPYICTPMMFVVQPGKKYPYGHQPYMVYPTFIIDGADIPGWGWDYRAANLKEASKPPDHVV